MDYFDTKRFKAVFPYLRCNIPKELTIKVINNILALRQQELTYNPKYKINNFDVDFDDSFDIFYPQTKLKILRLAEKKYADFDDIISRTADRMEGQFSESGRCNANGWVQGLTLKHVTIEKKDDIHIIRFVIIVEKGGRRGDTYYMSAGKISVFYK